MSATMKDSKREDKSLKLMERGFEQIRNYEYSKAVRTGKRLVKLRHTSGFEILGLAYDHLSRKKKAIRILEKGVKKAPDNWLLWQLLGNYYSDTEKYDEALAAYDRAVTCRDADLKSLRLNRALVLSRQGLDQKAVECLGEIRGTKVVDFRARSVKALLLHDVDQDARALKFAGNTLSKLNQLDEDFLWENADEFALVYSQLGKAFWQSGHQKEQALDCAGQALELKRGKKDALILLRSIENSYSPRAKYFRLLVQGEWPELLEDDDGEMRAFGFIASYDVVAENRKEALAILSELESEQVRASLKINESEVLEKRPDDPKGVYYMTGRGFFPLKKKSKK